MKKEEYTKKLFEEISINTEGMEHTRREAKKLETEGVDPKEYEQIFIRVESKAEELERPIGERLDTLEALVNAFDEMKQSKEFNEEKREGLVDVEKVDTMEDIIEEFREVLPRLLLIARLWENLADEQHKIVDTAQLAKDKASIENYIEKSTDSMRSAMKEMAEANKREIEQAREFYENRIGRESDKFEQVSQNQQKIGDTLEQQTQAINNLADAVQNIQVVQNPQHNQNPHRRPIQNQYNQNQPQPNQKQNQQGQDDGEESDEDLLDDADDLSSHEKELLKLVRKHGDDWDSDDYAEELGVESTSIGGYKAALSKKGYLDR